MYTSINNFIDIRFMLVQANVTMFRLTSGLLLRDSEKNHLPSHTRGKWSMHQISLADSDHGNILSVYMLTELRRGQCLQHSKERRRQSCRQCGNDNARRRTHVLFLNNTYIEMGENVVRHGYCAVFVRRINWTKSKFDSIPSCQSSFLPPRAPSFLLTLSPPSLLLKEMYSTLLTVALFIAPLIQGALADFAINSPDLVQVTF